MRWSPLPSFQKDNIQLITSSYAYQDRNLPAESIQQLFNTQLPVRDTHYKKQQTPQSSRFYLDSLLGPNQEGQRNEKHK